MKIRNAETGAQAFAQKNKSSKTESYMDYRKVDAALAAVVDEIKSAEEPMLAVFIYTAKSRDETATTFLNGIGVRVYSTHHEIFSATVSPQMVKKLSQQPWVRYVKLSQKLHMLNVSHSLLQDG